jgi:hypothetical protein
MKVESGKSILSSSKGGAATQRKEEMVEDVSQVQ